jgi:hypothetical protein
MQDAALAPRPRLAEDGPAVQPCPQCEAGDTAHLPAVDPPSRHRTYSEWELQARLISDMEAAGVNLVAREWRVTPDWPQDGTGDLVFELPCGTHLVVEVKWLNMGTGRTARSRRTRNRGHVCNQARRYADAWAARHPRRTVKAATFTNDTNYGGLRFLR